MSDALADYVARRDAWFLPYLELTTALAAMEPPPPERVALLTAIAADPDESTRYLAYLESAVWPELRESAARCGAAAGLTPTELSEVEQPLTPGNPRYIVDEPGFFITRRHQSQGLHIVLRSRPATCASPWAWPPRCWGQAWRQTASRGGAPARRAQSTGR